MGVKPEHSILNEQVEVIMSLETLLRTNRA